MIFYSHYALFFLAMLVSSAGASFALYYVGLSVLLEVIFVVIFAKPLIVILQNKNWVY